MYPLLLLLCLTSCIAYKVPTESFQSPLGNLPNAEAIYANEQKALKHTLYYTIPRHRCQIYWYDIGHWATWSLFGNDDDGIFGEAPTGKYRLQQRISHAKALRFWLRNPLHNCCFYVIGTAYRENSGINLLTLEYTPHATTTYGGDATALYIALHGGKPFISLRLAYTKTHASEFYFGWRHRGNFGAKCLLFTKYR